MTEPKVGYTLDRSITGPTRFGLMVHFFPLLLSALLYLCVCVCLTLLVSFRGKGSSRLPFFHLHTLEAIWQSLTCVQSVITHPLLTAEDPTQSVPDCCASRAGITQAPLALNFCE